MPDSPELNMFVAAADDVTVHSSFDNEFKNTCLKPKATTMQMSYSTERFGPLRLLFY